MPNYKLTLSYDGTRYRGWQRQGNTPDTIQEKLESVLSRILDQDVEVAGSGRTDAGVHAREQVCSFRAETALSAAELLDALREHLPEDIGAVSLEIAPPRFHARLNCTRKTYVYQVWNSSAPNVFRRRYMFALPGPLDLDAIRTAAADLVGSHDLLGFSSLRSSKRSTVREIFDVQILREGDLVRLVFTGTGFL